jgi:hypothetical protein
MDFFPLQIAEKRKLVVIHLPPIARRTILKGVASLQEIVHGVKTKNSGEFLKLDFKKANFN